MGCLKNGLFCIGPSMLVNVAFLLSLWSTSTCKFADIDGERSSGNQLIETVGMWCFEANGGNRYSLEGVSFDDQFDRARKLGMVANVTGFICWIIYILAGCCPFPPSVFVIIALGLLLASAMEGCKLILLKSEFFCEGDSSCTKDVGAKLSISAIVIYFIAALMTLAHAKERMGKKQKKKKDKQPEPEEKEEKEQAVPDEDEEANN